jgi:hypothetical protein
MGLPVGTTKITKVVVAANASYPTISNFPVMFDLSKCSAAWWAAVSVAGDIVVYEPVTDSIKPRHICSAFDAVNKVGWLTCNSAMSSAGRTLYLCAAPGYGAVNAAAAHTNSGCFSAHGFNETSGAILDKTGAYNGTASNLTYNQTGIVCKAAGFNGLSSNVSLGGVSSLNNLTQFTVSVLAKLRAGGSGGYLYSNSVSSTNRLMMLSLANGRLYVYVNESEIRETIADATPGSYYMYTVSVNLTSASVGLLINGVRVPTLPPVAPLPSSLGTLSAAPFLYGRASTSLDGSIDESRLWNRALSDQESFLEYKNLLDHNNFATYSDLAPSSRRPSMSFGFKKFGFGF